MIWLYIFIFILSCLVLFWSGSWLVGALMRIARYLGWREFVVAFCLMAFAGSLPNLFVGINAAFHKIPQLSLGDVVGGNVVDLTLAVALAVLISGAVLSAHSRMVQASAIFTTAIAILPLILLIDGKLGRGDGLILLLCFGFYIFWLFSREERFKKIYQDGDDGVVKDFKIFIRDLAKTILALGFLFLAAEGLVKSSIYFIGAFNLSIPFIGILIVGLGNALPETYFAIVSARKGQNWSVLGNLMGAIIVPATLVLGVVCLISPIKIDNFSSFAIARIFLVISSLFFLFIVRTGQKISKKEALILLSLYIIFVFIEILIK